MDITILGQGFNASNENSVGQQLIKFLERKDFHTFTGMSAFASPTGIIGLSKYILLAKKKFKSLNIIVGVDEKGTSKEALDAILALGINSYVFYQRSATIFHPKIYLFEGEKTSRLIVGSSNLTTRGLFTNVETSLLVSINNAIKAERKIVEDLKDYFKGIFDCDDPNLKKLTSKLIEDLVKANVVPTEAERRAIYAKSEKSENRETEILISRIFPKRATPKIPEEFRTASPALKKLKKTKTKAKGKTGARGNLVWTRRTLPASSVQAAGPTTNPTGGLRLVQDKFTIEGKVIDHTRYFRKTVFGNYTWKQIKTNPYVEVATVPFEITIKGKFIGEFDLEIRHKPSGEAGQHNYTTSISWGDIGETIRKEKLKGARLDLYAPRIKGNPFNIVIS